jgi:hypothetical protein
MFANGNRVWLTGLALGALLVTPTDAWAYVDPGTGSYLFQLAAAGFFAGMFTLRRCWDRVKAHAGRRATISAHDQATDANE